MRKKKAEADITSVIVFAIIAFFVIFAITIFIKIYNAVGTVVKP